MQTKARTSTTILMTVIKYGLQVFDWAAFVSGGAYLVWLLLSRNLLEPIPVGGDPDRTGTCCKHWLSLWRLRR